MSPCVCAIKSSLQCSWGPTTTRCTNIDSCFADVRGPHAPPRVTTAARTPEKKEVPIQLPKKAPALPVLPKNFTLPPVQFMKGAAIPEHITWERGRNEFHESWFALKGKRGGHMHSCASKIQLSASSNIEVVRAFKWVVF
jgi:hypothetical protein